jgi:hypothetical protein
MVRRVHGVRSGLSPTGARALYGAEAMCGLKRPSGPRGLGFESQVCPHAFIGVPHATTHSRLCTLIPCFFIAVSYCLTRLINESSSSSWGLGACRRYPSIHVIISRRLCTFNSPVRSNAEASNHSTQKCGSQPTHSLYIVVVTGSFLSA